MVLATDLPVKEASYFVTKSKQVAILTTSASKRLAIDIADYVEKTEHQKVRIIDIFKDTQYTPITPSEIIVSHGQEIDPNAPGVVIFTSGTSGPPKGAIQSRAYMYSAALATADAYGVTHKDVMLNVLPVHHATGIGLNIFPFLVSGSCIEFRSGSFDPSWMWERWKQSTITFFSGVPTMYVRMMRYYEQNIARLPDEVTMDYKRGVMQLRVMLCGSSSLPGPTQDFWTKMRGGKMILTRYGGTELGIIFSVALDPGYAPSGSVGTPFPGVDVKLSDGNEGEILVKSPFMFSK